MDRLAYFTGLVLAVAMFSTGCTTLQTSRALDGAALDAKGGEVVHTQVPAAGSISIEIHEAGKEPESVALPLQHGMTLQDALVQSRLTERFRRMKLHLMRKTPQGMAKLDSSYNHSKARVDILHDYALHPDDQVVVTEDTRTVLDDMFSQLGGALGPMGPKMLR